MIMPCNGQAWESQRLRGVAPRLFAEPWSDFEVPNVPNQSKSCLNPPFKDSLEKKMFEVSHQMLWPLNLVQAPMVSLFLVVKSSFFPWNNHSPRRRRPWRWSSGDMPTGSELSAARLSLVAMLATWRAGGGWRGLWMAEASNIFKNGDVFIYIYNYIYIYICVYIYILYNYMYVCIYICVCACVCVTSE